MRLTRPGWGCLFVAVLTLMSAATTGNNLLYLLYSALVSALILSWAAGWLNLRSISARAEAPDLVFRGSEFPLKVVIRSLARWPAYGIAAVCRGARASAPRIDPGGEAAVELRYSLPHRGLNRVDDVQLESLFPFGLIRHRRRVPGLIAKALPRLGELHSAAEIKADVEAYGRPTMRKGAGDELYGIREYDPSDDSRAINWKLTAKTGRPLVNEYAAPQDAKVTVRVAGVEGEGAEQRIEEAAAACRFYIDAGGEVSLETPEERLDFGKGLLQLDKMLNALARLGEGKMPRSAGRASPAAPGEVEVGAPLRRLTLLGAALVYAALFLVDDINVVMLATLAPILPLGWFMSERRTRRLPGSVWNAASLAVLVYIVLVDWRSSGVIIADTHLLLYLLANKSLTEIKAAEYHQFFLILLLAFFMVSGLTISLWYFTFFLLFVAFAAAWLMLASGGAFSGPRPWTGAYAALVPACLALSAFSFAATPRVEGLRRINPFLSAGMDKLKIKSSAVSGFTENVSLGFYGELKKSSARVMRIKPDSPPAGRSAPALYVRGASYEKFDGRRWSKPMVVDFHYRIKGRVYTSTVGRGWARRRGDQLFFPAAPSPQSLPPYEFTIYPMGLYVVFTVGTPWLIQGVDDSVYFDYTDSAYFATPYLGGTRYRQYANSGPVGFDLKIQGYRDSPKGGFLQLPKERDQRVHDLALRAAGGAAGDLNKAMAVVSFLRRGYAYSMFSESAQQGLEDFLFTTRKGNCEYFATAGVILLRHLGVPARLATGFLADDWNEYGKFYDVRQSEAHAWVEAYVRGVGWITLDPTPAQGAFSASADALSRRLERYFNAIQVKWYRNVIGYDQYVQGNTFRRLELAVSEQRLKRWGRLGVEGLLAATLLLGLALGLWHLLAALRRPPAGDYPRAQAALERAGLPRQPFWTPREYARWVAGVRPDLAALGPLAELHYLQRYSPRGLSPGQSDEARRLLGELRSRL